MYNPNDTICAVSSPTNDQRVIIRLSGSKAIEILNSVCPAAIPFKAGITSCKISGINLEAKVYLFCQPHSYTGDDLAELHLWANQSITEFIMQKLLILGARNASPGEFTARAYLNNKMDLAQAEAVNEVITASNTFQLAAAENLLAGRLGQLTKTIRESILEVLSRIEADLDFSSEETLSNKDEILARLEKIIKNLNELLSDSIRSESSIDLPSVGIAGAPNAGKSTLLNKLLGRKRSIVSHKRKTTRDVLTGEFELPNCRCILFDCAGLITRAENIIDELAQAAAIEALKNASVVIFCVDIEKGSWDEDLSVFQLIKSKALITVASKIDLIKRNEIEKELSKLNSIFKCDFLPVSAQNNSGIDELKNIINQKIIEAAGAQSKIGVALTTRHRQSLNNAINDMMNAENEINSGSEETAAMMVRNAYNHLSIEQEYIDEQVLDRIFSHFCIGK